MTNTTQTTQRALPALPAKFAGMTAKQIREQQAELRAAAKIAMEIEKANKPASRMRDSGAISVMRDIVLKQPGLKKPASIVAAAVATKRILTAEGKPADPPSTASATSTRNDQVQAMRAAKRAGFLNDAGEKWLVAALTAE